jgi:pSer/pThr/pTyr-binding forkhead associated (FHA) protein
MVTKPAQTYKIHCLLVEDDRGRKEIILKKTSYSIGRGKQCDIPIHSPFVSRHHATILRRFRDNGNVYYEIVDGDGRGNFSANGILVNGRKLTSHELKHGDKIVFGPQVFAIYQHSQRDIFPTMPPDDPFDITLIDPSMMADDREEDLPEDVPNSS